MEHIGMVTHREEKTIAKGKNAGNKFLNITLEPDKWTYSLFDGQHIGISRRSDSLKVIWEEDGEFRKVVDVQIVEGQQAVTLSNGADLRERRITRVAIAKSLIEAAPLQTEGKVTWRLLEILADQWFNWVWEIQEKEPIPRSQEDIDQSEETLVAEIKKLADGQTIRNAMDKLSYTEAKLSDCDAGKLAEIRDRLKDSKLV